MESASPALEPKRAIGYLLQHVASTLGRQSDQVLQEQLGIGMSQFKLLMILRHSPHIPQRHLADNLGQTEASISRQIKLLVEKGLLIVKINPKSKREHITVPTPKGIAITEAARDILGQHFDPMYANLHEKQQKQLVETLATLHAWVCQPGKLVACDHPFKL
jgi:DNA-binding MarR family transcriptional regulator